MCLRVYSDVLRDGPCKRAEGPMPPNLSRPAEPLHPLGRCDGRWAALITANLRPQPPPEAEQPRRSERSVISRSRSRKGSVERL